MYAESLQCFACGASQPFTFKNYLCPACGGNLEVMYDVERLAKAVKLNGAVQVERNDIFRYEAFLPVSRLDLASPLRVGMTPLYERKRAAESVGLKKIYFKDEGLNPSASFKDRAGAVALVRARETGAKVIAGASTGNAGSSMACLAASVGIPCVIFVPEKAPAAKIAQLLIFGAKVLAVRGTYDDAFDLCMKVCAEKGWFNRNTGYNPFTREGKKTCSFEICEQLGWKAPDRVVVPAGDGNIISGIWKGMLDLYAVGLIKKLPKIDCAQSAQSAAISRAIHKLRAKGGCGMEWAQVVIQPVQAATLADSISVDIPRDGLAAVRAVIESGGEAVEVLDEEILAAIPDLARHEGIFAEPAAACAWAALKKMAHSRLVNPEELVVCPITGNGLKDVANARKAAGEPYGVDNSVEAVNRVLESLAL
ncbi:MAG: threonine synthase [Lentisphaerota bacterium]